MTWESPTSIDWSNGFGSVFYYVNSVSLGWASRMFLIAIFIIVFTAYYKTRDEYKGAFAFSSLATFILALMGWLTNFVDLYTLIYTTAVLLVALAVLFVTDDTY